MAGLKGQVMPTEEQWEDDINGWEHRDEQLDVEKQHRHTLSVRDMHTAREDHRERAVSVCVQGSILYRRPILYRSRSTYQTGKQVVEPVAMHTDIDYLQTT